MVKNLHDLEVTSNKKSEVTLSLSLDSQLVQKAGGRGDGTGKGQELNLLGGYFYLNCLILIFPFTYFLPNVISSLIFKSAFFF